MFEFNYRSAELLPIFTVRAHALCFCLSPVRHCASPPRSQAYCPPGDVTIDNFKLVKLAKDAGLLSYGCTSSDIDVLFNKVRPSSLLLERVCVRVCVRAYVLARELS